MHVCQTSPESRCKVFVDDVLCSKEAYLHRGGCNFERNACRRLIKLNYFLLLFIFTCTLWKSLGFFCPICMVFCGKSCTITLWVWLSVLTQLITTHPSGDSLTSRPGKTEQPETIKVQAAVFLSFHISTMQMSIPGLLLQWWYSEFFPVSRRPAGPLTSGFAVSWTLVPGWVLSIRADASAVR